MARRYGTSRRRALLIAALSAALAPAAGPAAAEPAAAGGGRTVGAVLAAVVDGERRGPRPVAAFPVRGPVGYGESGARFGADRGGRMHAGQDVFAASGSPLLAIRDGVVLEAGDGGGRGNYVALFSPLARETYVYLHMREPSPLRPGRRVRAGSRVGRVGCTGSCWGEHLHLEIRRGRGTEAPPRNPLPLLRALAGRRAGPALRVRP